MLVKTRTYQKLELKSFFTVVPCLFDNIKSLFFTTDAQLVCSKRMLKFTCILYKQRYATYTMSFIIISALHVLVGFYTHHQELIKLYVQSWVLSCFFLALFFSVYPYGYVFRY